jgi:hypothetical protein
MATTLANAVTILDTADNTATGTYTATEKHEAIKEACDEFLRFTDSSTVTTDVSLSASVTTVNIPGTIAEFVADDFVSAKINEYPVKLVPVQTVERRQRGAVAPSGRPTMIGLRVDGEGIFDKSTDKAYTMKVTRVKPLITFTAGTTDTTAILNIPDKYAHSIIYWGARRNLLSGAEGDTNEVAKADEMFNRLIRKAINDFPSTRSQVHDPNVQN